MKEIVSLATVLFGIFVLPQIARSQGICISDQKTLRVPMGVVIEPVGVPIPGALIELHEKEFMGPIVSQMKTDIAGRFEF